MKDLKEKADEAISKLQNFADLQPIIAYIFWLECQVNTHPPVHISSPFTINPPFEPGDIPPTRIVFGKPGYSQTTTSDGTVMKSITVLLDPEEVLGTK